MSAFSVVAFPDNQHALSCANDGLIVLFNAIDGKILRSFMRYWQGPVFDLALLSDGLRFVSGSGELRDMAAHWVRR